MRWVRQRADPREVVFGNFIRANLLRRVVVPRADIYDESACVVNEEHAVDDVLGGMEHAHRLGPLEEVERGRIGAGFGMPSLAPGRGLSRARVVA